MKKGKIRATVSGVMVGVFIVASLMTGPVNTVYAQTPQVITPANGAIIDCDPVPGRSVPVTFSWSPFKETTKYKFVVAKDAAMTQVVDEAEVTTTTYQYSSGRPNPLECGASYFWRVMALEPAPSDWSATFSFTVKSTSMPIPTKDYYRLRLLSPNDGASGCPVKPASFSWSPFKETTKYKFVLAKDAAMTQVVAEAEVPTTAHEYNGTLNYSTNYFWRVMALEPAPSDWSTTFCFQTGAGPEAVPEAPGVPAVPRWALNHAAATISPAGEVFSDTHITFKWVGAGGLTYILEIADNLNFLPCATGHSGLTQSTCTIDLEPGTYYWRVKAVDSNSNESEWGLSPYPFKVKAAVDTAAPMLLSPNNGTIGCPVKPASFSWSPFKETTKYKFVLAKDAAMTQVVTEAKVATTAFEYDGTLYNSTNYFWRVRAIEPSLSDWSAVFVFQTEPKPGIAAPAPMSPTGSPESPPAGLSCRAANADQKTTSLDASTFLIGALLMGLAVAGQRKRDK